MWQWHSQSSPLVVSAGEGLGNQFLSNIREVEVILHMVRCFEDENITHVENSINPLRDVEIIESELIKLYAARKASDGYAFSSDTYLQHELEASFLYEDTPDQLKATLDVKADMERLMPMDRLICGDVGFGKTEVALRAAFKAVADSKQVAILVPTTILALQHYKTFRDRLRDFPCRVDYINRFRTLQQLREALKEVVSGKTDIIIGTHRLLSKDVVFNDLGPLS